MRIKKHVIDVCYIVIIIIYYCNRLYVNSLIYSKLM